jgi:Phage integrase family
MAQLLSPDSPSLLEKLAGPTARAAVELQAGIGRRTGELCGLRFGCLDYDERVGEDGKRVASPVLVHDMPKVGKVDCRLAIHDREAKIITVQQARVRAMFRATPPERLALFPRPLKNPDGTTAVSTGWLERAVRIWVDALPRLDGPDHDAGGQPLPFPKDRVFPYAFRHSFAQRHADSGTDIDVLKELLGHDTIRVTGCYYRVTARRKRAAQDTLGPLQLDATGHLVRPGVTGLTQAEVLRDQLGQVAVPFGICTEPRNVAAEGHACPFRHRCTGCTYFRTDPSYQPELKAYLANLIGDRERLAAAVPQLVEWARRDAAPSEEEIEAVRNLIRSNDEALATLDAIDRDRIESAISTIRTARASLTNTFPVELRGLVRQTRPRLFPGIERAAGTEATGA